MIGLEENEKKVVDLYLWSNIEYVDKCVDSLMNDLQDIVETLMGKHKTMLTFNKYFAEEYSTELERTYSDLRICKTTLQDLLTDSKKRENLDYIYPDLC